MHNCLVILYLLCWHNPLSYFNKQALVDTTDHEIYVSLTCSYSERGETEKGTVGTQLMGERAKIILDEVRDLSLFTRRQCLEHIGTCYGIYHVLVFDFK
jgi:hypothetical protein